MARLQTELKSMQKIQEKLLDRIALLETHSLAPVPHTDDVFPTDLHSDFEDYSRPSSPRSQFFYHAMCESLSLGFTRQPTHAFYTPDPDKTAYSSVQAFYTPDPDKTAYSSVHAFYTPDLDKTAYSSLLHPRPRQDSLLQHPCL